MIQSQFHNDYSLLARALLTRFLIGSIWSDDEIVQGHAIVHVLGSSHLTLFCGEGHYCNDTYSNHR